ncbi:hypothetical protein BJ138DRAFT_1173146 [Hygrophoropsis aurantiaca]|uniref:Uncharacterized protein n=1 Tax=Hygrophoropsis aurantiaca TaxID=72124 RepID=A0ACB8AB23_9AGAM|nr:hypothetical protein BJ138DRAFT_1173146 [Hygrophoropsis aurantiaca]
MTLSRCPVQVRLMDLYHVFHHTQFLHSPRFQPSAGDYKCNDRHECLARVSLPNTYITHDSDTHLKVRARPTATAIAPNQSPDVTAVVLNWSRLPNVIRIVDTLCQSSIEDVIAEVFIWNNSPQSLSYDIFSNTTCSAAKLRIYNSPSNLYFQARFLACAKSQRPYCFLQDDDYLVLPELIRTLRARIVEDTRSAAIHLLPPHEHLSSQLRTIHSSKNIHTSFAWLGHGAILRKSQAIEFLSLLRHINASSEEGQMADNYFTILSNRISQIWFDQGIEMGGGQPFTVGSEGDSRNKRHIIRAAQYLDALTADSPPKTSSFGQTQVTGLEFVDFTPTPMLDIMDISARSPCLGIPCLLETNIPLIMKKDNHTVSSAEDMLSQEARSLQLIGARKEHYYRYPPSHAVDGCPDTVFRSPQHGRAGDYISLDYLSLLSFEDDPFELVLLVPEEMEQILCSSIVGYSADALRWTSSAADPTCTDVLTGQTDSLRECSIVIPMDDSTTSARFFHVKLQKDVPIHWRVHEIWLR